MNINVSKCVNLTSPSQDVLKLLIMKLQQATNDQHMFQIKFETLTNMNIYPIFIYFPHLDFTWQSHASANEREELHQVLQAMFSGSFSVTRQRCGLNVNGHSKGAKATVRYER